VITIKCTHCNKWDDCCFFCTMNKIIGCTVLFFLISISVCSQSIIIAEISNVKNDNGLCRACLFKDQATFEGATGKPLQCVSAPVKVHTAQAVFNNVLPGTYAIFVFHDANSNNKIDKNFIGIPKEGYGASNNKLPFAGAPSFNENKFSLNGRTTKILQIKIMNI